MIPVNGAHLPVDGNLSYGYRRSPTHVHNGIDLPAPVGTPIHAAAAGHVEHANSVWVQGFTGYGRNVVLAHDDGARTLYGHMDTVAVVPGEFVAEGAPLGTVGRTEFGGPDHDTMLGPKGAHLHFEAALRSYPMPPTAERIDPVAWLLARGMSPEDLARAQARFDAARDIPEALIAGGLLLAALWYFRHKQKGGA